MHEGDGDHRAGRLAHVLEAAGLEQLGERLVDLPEARRKIAAVTVFDVGRHRAAPSPCLPRCPWSARVQPSIVPRLLERPLGGVYTGRRRGYAPRRGEQRTSIEEAERETQVARERARGGRRGDAARRLWHPRGRGTVALAVTRGDRGRVGAGVLGGLAGGGSGALCRLRPRRRPWQRRPAGRRSRRSRLLLPHTRQRSRLRRGASRRLPPSGAPSPRSTSSPRGWWRAAASPARRWPSSRETWRCTSAASGCARSAARTRSTTTRCSSSAPRRVPTRRPCSPRSPARASCAGTSRCDGCGPDSNCGTAGRRGRRPSATSRRGAADCRPTPAMSCARSGTDAWDCSAGCVTCVRPPVSAASTRRRTLW